MTIQEFLAQFPTNIEVCGTDRKYLAFATPGADEEANLQLTLTAIQEALGLGFTIPEGKDTSTKEGWNAIIEELGIWLQLQAEALTPSAPEIEPTPVNANDEPAQSEEGQEIVEETISAAKDIVATEVGKAVAAQMTDAELIDAATALSLRPAQEKAAQMTLEAYEELEALEIAFREKIAAIKTTLKGSGAIQLGVMKAIEASAQALPANVEEPVAAE